MAFSRACRCLLLVSLALLPLGMADSIGKYCAGSSYAGSNTMATINSVLADLVAKGSSAGFATSSAGKGNNVIYGLAQCRGDVSASDCAVCLAAAAKKLPTACGYQADARIWYDYCFMRYDSTNFVGKSDTNAAVILFNQQTASNPESFKEAVGNVMDKATLKAAATWFGTAKDQYTPSVTIYGLAQCTRDLAPMTCAQCLSAAVSNFGQYCGAHLGCQINYSSCRVRYEIYPFFYNGGTPPLRI